MKISLDWLNTYLDRSVDADQVEKVLTDQGLPIECRLPPVGDGQDVVLDVEVTSNRSDCLSHLGIAREVAAGVGCRVIEPACNPPKPEGDSPNGDTRTRILFPVRNEAPDRCPLYTARVIQAVRVGPSPDWLMTRLESIGLRSVNNVVDVTNFVLHEMGQPLHAFDLAKLEGGQIVVRGAKEAEPFAAIDGSKHQLASDMLVIADGTQPVAVAGVMGGADTEVTETTTDILLESATFDPLSVRRASRALKLASDSSYRFERGVDPLGVEKASQRAAGLILELAGGIIGAHSRVGIDPPASKTVAMRVDRCNQIIGVDLAPKRIIELLSRLGLGPRLEDQPLRAVCAIPTFRLDLDREIDLIEEVARLHGYDAVPVTEKIHIVASPPRPTVTARRKLDQVLVAHGFHEAITLSFVAEKYGARFLDDTHQPLTLDDERRTATPMLRPSLIPSLMACRKSNQDVGNAGVRLYETATTWARDGADVVERHRLGLLADAPDPQQGLREIRGTIEEAVELLAGAGALSLEPDASPVFQAVARIKMLGQETGWLGLVDPHTQDLFDLQTPVVAAEFDLPVLLEAYPPDRSVGELARFPAVERDLSIVVKEGVSWASIERLITDADLDRLESLRFLGAYRGKPIPDGHKSVAMRLRFRDHSTTLRREQVDDQVTVLIDRMVSQLGATLRQ